MFASEKDIADRLRFITRYGGELPRQITGVASEGQWVRKPVLEMCDDTALRFADVCGSPGEYTFHIRQEQGRSALRSKTANRATPFVVVDGSSGELCLVNAIGLFAGYRGLELVDGSLPYAISECQCGPGAELTAWMYCSPLLPTAGFHRLE